MRFSEWLKANEMAGTGAIYDGSGDTEDYQWWGDPKSAGYTMKKPKGAKKRKKKKPDVKTKDKNGDD
jgi:hypothetical protein